MEKNYNLSVQLVDDNITSIYEYSNNTKTLAHICNVNKGTRDQCAGLIFWKPILVRDHIALPIKPFNTVDEWLRYFDTGRKVNDLFEDEIINLELNIPINDVIGIFKAYGINNITYGVHLVFTTKVTLIATPANIHFGNEDPDNIYQVNIESNTKNIKYKLDVAQLKKIIHYFYMHQYVTKNLL